MKRISVTGLIAGLALLLTQTALADGRTDLEGPGDAEVIAGTGYTHTLFDSADNKCQHCHNDLYDTWKTSMHAKSWADPLFQIKYQDFLRLQAGKIGATGPTGEYKEGTIQKTAQVCIKCHAPTAYYSGDYEVTLSRVGGDYDDPVYDPVASYNEAKSMEVNLSVPPSPANPNGIKYNPAEEATVAALAQTGQAYTVTYHIGNSHNREGVNCSFCHSIETVRMFDKYEGSDGGEYTLKGPIKMGPIGPKVREAGDTLHYSANADAPDMNAFFALIGPEKYTDFGNTPKVEAYYDVDKAADGRYTMKSTETCQQNDDEGLCGVTAGYYTGGPFYGPFGITGLSNSRDDDLSDRELLVKDGFRDAVGEHPDKFEDKHQFAAYGKALCLSCHQRSSLMLNPESNGQTGVQPKGDNPDQFLELCSTWTAMSDGIGDNYTDTEYSPKCQRCHMEPLNKIKGERVTVLHQWDQPDVLFTKDDEEYLTAPFDPDSGYGPVAEGYLNNHAFMGANTADFGTTKIKTGFKAGLDAEDDDGKIVVKTTLQNETAHMFPGAHPIRRVLTRVVVTDANDNMIPYESAKGKSKYKSIKNKVAVLGGNKIKPGFKKVDVKYDENRNIVIQGYTPDLDEYGEPVTSQIMDQSSVPWASPDGTVTGGTPTQVPHPTKPGETIWVIKGNTTVKKIIEDTNRDYFTRIYGRETGKRKDGTHVVRPGFDSNIAADNRLKPNEKEEYEITYDASYVEAWPVTVKIKVYFMKKGAGGVFPTDPATGFLNANLPDWKKKKLAIFEVASKEETVEK